MKKKLGLWIRASRAPFFTASIIPVALGAAVAVINKAKISWLLFPVVVVSSILVHTATNMANDYFDFKKGVDVKGSFGSSGVLIEGLITPKQLIRVTYILFILGFALSLILVAIRGLSLFILGLIGILGGYLYSGGPKGLKYLGLGEIMVFLLMGPLISIGSYLSLTGRYNHNIFYISLPVGFLITAILYANNLRDIKHDKQAKVTTLTGVLGFRKAKPLYCLLVIAAYISVTIMILAKTLPLLSLIVFASLPLALKNIKTVSASNEGHLEKISTMDVNTAKLHFLFGILLIISIFAAGILS